MYKLLLFLFVILFPQISWGDANSNSAQLLIQEQNGTNAGRYRVLKVSNGTTTNNGDGSISVTTGSGGGGGGTPSLPLNSVQYNNATNFGGSSNFIFNGTNVGIGSINPQTKLDINGNISNSQGDLEVLSKDESLNLSESGGVTLKDAAGSGMVLESDGSDVNVNAAQINLNSGTYINNSLSIGGSYTTASIPNGLLVQTNVGIGTVTPEEALDVFGNITNSQGDLGVYSGPQALTLSRGSGITLEDGLGSGMNVKSDGGTLTLSTTGHVSGTDSLILDNSGVTLEDGIGSGVLIKSDSAGIVLNGTSLKLANITGLIQCLQVDTTGLVTGTNNACGTSSGGSNYWNLTSGNVGINTTNNVSIGTTGSGFASLSVKGGVEIGTGAGNLFPPANGLEVSGNLGVGVDSVGVSAPLEVYSASAPTLSRVIESFGDGSSAPTSLLNADYLQLGGQEFNVGSYRAIGFGYLGSSFYGSKFAPAYIGYKESSVSGDTQGDLVFMQRNTGIGTIAPNETLRVLGSSGNVGIGTSIPQQKLDVAGTIRMVGLSMPTGASSGYVLTSNSVGIGTWAPVTSGGGTGTVTSVGASVPSVLSISGSPVTTSGTLAIGYSGTALPLANGGTGQTSQGAATNALAALTLNMSSALYQVNSILPSFAGQPLITWDGNNPQFFISNNTGLGNYTKNISVPQGIDRFGEAPDSGFLMGDMAITDFYVNSSITGQQGTGDSGVLLQNFSSDPFNSGASWLDGVSTIDANGNAKTDDAVGFSFTDVPGNRYPSLDPGYGIVVENASSIHHGFAVSSPGASGIDSGNYPYYVADMKNHISGMLKWTQGNYTGDDVGVISSATIGTAGTGYAAGEVARITQSGCKDGYVEITHVTGGVPDAISLNGYGLGFGRGCSVASGLATTVGAIQNLGFTPAIKVNAAGIRYNVGDSLTVSGGNGDATTIVGRVVQTGYGLQLTAAVSSGIVTSGTITSGGLGYVVGEIVQPTGGTGSGATFYTTSVGTNGVVTGISLATGGTLYTNGDTLFGGPATNIGGPIAILNIMSLDYLGKGTGYSTATNVSLSGSATGSGATANISTYGGAGSGLTINITGINNPIWALSVNPATGNVGIGTWGPSVSHALEVVGTVSATAFVGNGSGLTGITSGAAGSNAQVQYNSSGSLAANSGFVYSGTNVGIGTTLTNFATLAVKGGVEIGTGAGNLFPPSNGLEVSGNTGLGLSSLGAQAQLEVFGTSNLARIIQSAGDSASAPTNLISGNYMQLGGQEYTVGSYAGIGMGYNNGYVTGTHYSPAYITEQETSQSGDTMGDLVLLTRANVTGATVPTDNLHIVASSGNIGIGTFVPAQKLDVRGTVTATNFIGAGTGLTGTAASLTAGTVSTISGLITNGTNISISGAGTSGSPYSISSSGGGSGLWNTVNTNDVSESNSSTYGNVGIGTNATSGGRLIVVGGNVGIGTTLATAQLTIIGSGSSFFSSNVGIGSNSPSVALDVSGNIKSSTMSGQADGTLVCIKNGRIGYCSGIVTGISCTCN